MTAAHTLAHAATATIWRELPADVRARAGAVILDTLAVMAGGAADPAHARFVQASAAAPGPCTVIGHPVTTDAASAALVNGATTTVLQLQDGHRLGRGHPASHILPALLAVAEEQNATTDAFLGSFVGAYEASARVGVALGGLQAGIHDAGTWGTIGAGVGAALLLSRDPAVIARVIDAAAAATMLPWSQTAPQGAAMHHLYIGLAAAMGVTIARAAVADWDALPGAVEHFFGPRAGAAFDPQRLRAGVNDGRWTSFEILRGYLKRYPTCAHLHGTNQAVEDLLAAEAVRPADIESVEIATYKHAIAYDNEHPQTVLAARFSAAYSVAIALVAGGLDYGAITAQALQDPAVRALAARIHVRHDPELDRFYPDGRPSRVTVRLKDGRERSAFAMHPRGDATNPASDAELRDKARTLLGWRYGGAGAERILLAWDAVLAGGALNQLTQALRA